MEQVLETLEVKYGCVKPLTGGFTNDTYLLDTAPPLVAKIASLSNEDILNEMNTLKFVEESSVAPKFIETLKVGLSTILITTFKQGMNGQAILDMGNINTSNTLFHRMGISLAQKIHCYKYDKQNNMIRSGGVVDFHLDFVPEEYINKSRAYLENIHARRSEWVLTHGDYGSHNILFEKEGHFTVIDWEWAEWCHPIADIAWTCWNTKLHYPNIADELNQTFINAYQSVKPIICTDNDIKTYSLYKLWNILKKVQNAGEETHKKWVKRLEWTLNPDLKFINV